MKGFRRPIVKDEFGVVLDYMPYGNPSDRHPHHRSRAIAQVIGTKYFSLVEIFPLKNVQLSIGERIPIASSPETPGHPISERITYEDLTSVARDNLPKILRDIVIQKERVFVAFFNVAEPINIRLHSLELLPGVGKKTLMVILEERNKKPFESFDDIQKRTRINDPAKLIVDRILSELQRTEKYYLFVDPYPPSPEYVRLYYLEKLYEITGYSEPW